MTQNVVILRATNRARAATTGDALPSILITQLASLTLSVAFVNTADTPVVDTLGGTSTSVRCVLKETPNGSSFLLDSDMPLTGTGTTARYTASLDDAEVDGSALRTFLATATASDQWELKAWLEIEWTIDGDTQRVFFPVTVRAAFLTTDTVAPPIIASSVQRYYPLITGLTGGGSTKLDGITTTTLAARSIAELVINNGTYDLPQKWFLKTWTSESEDGTDIILPDDFHTTTNPQVWIKIG